MQNCPQLSCIAWNPSKCHMWRSIRSWLRCLGFVHVCHMQKSHIFKWANKKTHTRPFTKFSGLVGDTKSDITAQFWGGLTREFWGEKGGRKIFDPPYLPLGGQGALKFFCVTEAYRPHDLTKYWATEFKRGFGGRSPKKFRRFLGRLRGAVVPGPPKG